MSISIDKLKICSRIFYTIESIGADAGLLVEKNADYRTEIKWNILKGVTFFELEN